MDLVGAVLDRRYRTLDGDCENAEKHRVYRPDNWETKKGTIPRFRHRVAGIGGGKRMDQPENIGHFTIIHHEAPIVSRGI